MSETVFLWKKKIPRSKNFAPLENRFPWVEKLIWSSTIDDFLFHFVRIAAFIVSVSLLFINILNSLFDWGQQTGQLSGQPVAQLQSLALSELGQLGQHMMIYLKNFYL